ncbi:hypothetical protein [Thiomicrorhabdus cannonii]|uniref:hypothetical protein n=1 Tax=Thiomicrorhabdus cannonii TaxID=2748011 RepID=UPI0015BCB022|nr:hypothetical protein [Thiomicrorhabdus cannonii]
MFRIYLIYIVVAVIGWFCGQVASQWLSSLNELHWLRPAISVGVGSLAIKQAMAIKDRLGKVQSIEGLTNSERNRIKTIIDSLKKESLFGLVIVITGNIVVAIMAFTSLNTNTSLSLILSIFCSVTLFSLVLLVRMHWSLGNQIDGFEALIRNRIEDQNRRKTLLEKLKDSNS